MEFFPEGGHLVNGIESRVAFEVFGADGINSSSSITILADGSVRTESLTKVADEYAMSFFDD